MTQPGAGHSEVEPGADMARTPLDPLTERFLRTWRVLDSSPLRPVWPFVLGAVYAGFALILARSVLIAAGIAVGLVAATGWFGRSVCERLEEMDRFSD